MPTSVTYTAVLTMNRDTVEFLSRLLAAQRRRRRTRRGRRALGCFTHAVLVLRWFLDGTRITQLARDHGIGGSTTYRYLHEGIDALAAQAPDLHAALHQAKEAGLTHVNLDGVVIPTDRSAVPGPNGHDLWWSGNCATRRCHFRMEVKDRPSFRRRSGGMELEAAVRREVARSE